MKYSIENDFLKAEISDLGAEITSIILKEDMCEYIWQGDAKYWTGHAPVMFPVCGRLYEGKYTYHGQTYELGNHGFARKSIFDLTTAKSNEITLTLKSNEETKKVYPFDFTLNITFTLNGKSLEIKHRVKNDGDENLIFTIGAHPAFNVPLLNDEVFEDYYVDFEKSCEAYRVDFSPTCFCTKNDKPLMENGTKRINLKHSLFDNDAIFLYNVPKKVSLKSNKSKKGVTVSFNGMKYLGLWHKPQSDAPYICIEPWCGIPSTDGIVDDLSTKDEMIHLPKGYTYNVSYKIEIK